MSFETEPKWPRSRSVNVRHSPRIEALLAEVAKQHEITREELLGSRQYSHLVRARVQVARSLSEMGLSLPRIGRVLGGRHHTTIHHYLRRFGVKSEPQEYRFDLPDESGLWAI